jgi:sn-glycerol 3-phosphate transport system substrate-binding protein
MKGIAAVFQFIRRHKKSSLIGGLAGILVLAGCSSAGSAPNASSTGSSTGPVTVTLWESQSNQPVASAMQGIVQQYNAAHPGTTVQLHLISQGTQVMAAVAAHNPPIMGEVNHYIAQFRQANALVSFTPYINGSNGFSQQQISQFYPNIWTDGLVNGQRYRMLVDTKVSELFYNKNLFKRAGISSPPTTYTQLAQDLAILKQKLPGVTPMAIDDGIGDILPPFIANGGQLYAPGSGQKKADFQSQAATTTFNYFRQAFQKGQVIFSNTDGVRSLFAQNRLAIADQTSAGSAPIVAAAGGKFPVGAFVWPNGSTGHSGNVIQGEGIIMMKGYTQRQYNAAWSFIKFWMQPKEQAYWAVHSGYAPETKAALQYITPQQNAANPGLAVSEATLASPYTVHRPVADNYSQVENLVAAAFFKAVEGQQSVASALSGLQQSANAVLSGQGGFGG